MNYRFYFAVFNNFRDGLALVSQWGLFRDWRQNIASVIRKVNLFHTKSQLPEILRHHIHLNLAIIVVEI